MAWVYDTTQMRLHGGYKDKAFGFEPLMRTNVCVALDAETDIEDMFQRQGIINVCVLQPQPLNVSLL